VSEKSESTPEIERKGGDTPRKQPIYERIKSTMRQQIESGELLPGSRVASEQALATELSVSRGQVRQALRDLEMEGLLERFPGRGSFVAAREKAPGGWRRPNSAKSLIFAYPGLARDSYTYHLRRLVEGFVHEAVAQEFHATFFYLDADQEAELRFLKSVTDFGVEGMVLWPQFRTPEECSLVERITQSNFPCVLVDRYLPGVESDFVGTANRMAFARLTNQLIERNHRQIGYLTRGLDDSVIEDRYAGYCYALEQAGIEPRDELMAQGRKYGVDLEPVLAFFTRTRKLPSPPTAYVCSDCWAADVLEEAIRISGICAVSDIEIATMDDTLAPEGPNPTNRSVAVQDGFEIGRQAAALLITRIAGQNRVFDQRFIRPQFLQAGERGSCSASKSLDMSERR
jgi:GntR family transcriptional regulator of arabinose operon